MKIIRYLQSQYLYYLFNIIFTKSLTGKDQKKFIIDFNHTHCNNNLSRKKLQTKILAFIVLNILQHLNCITFFL